MTDCHTIVGLAENGAEIAGRENALPITVKSLIKNYGNFRALDDVSVEIHSGEFLTLLGPSGSGKTTLLMVLAGFVRPDSGSVSFGDREVLLLPPHKRDIGMVFQNYALFPHMSVAGNLAYPLRLRGVPKATTADKVQQTLDIVRLSGLGDRGINELSGGQRQRVALARAIIFEPRILLMDEPLSALDKNLREEMQFEVRALHDRLGITTVYVTHDQREALTMSDRIAVVNNGKIQQIDAPQTLYEQPQTYFVANFVGETHCLPVKVQGGKASLNGQPIKVAAPLGHADPDQMLILRPENLHILDEAGDPKMNEITGIVKKNVFQGDSVVIYIKIASGHEIAVRRQHRSDEALPQPGSNHRIGWLAQDTVIVPERDT